MCVRNAIDWAKTRGLSTVYVNWTELGVFDSKITADLEYQLAL